VSHEVVEVVDFAETYSTIVHARAVSLADRALLLQVRGIEAGRVHPMCGDGATLGRGAACTVVLDDPSLSRVHARLRRTLNRDFVFEDLASRNGSFVNGRRVTEVLLRDGGRVQLGAGSLLCFRVVGAEEERALSQLYESSVRDALTGLFNRRFLDASLEAGVRRTREGGADLALLMLDVDHFKRANDVHGHAACDAVLRHIAALVGECVGPRNIAARFGGEEIAVLARATSLAPAADLGARLRAQRSRSATSRCASR